MLKFRIPLPTHETAVYRIALSAEVIRSRLGAASTNVPPNCGLVANANGVFARPVASDLNPPICVASA